MSEMELLKKELFGNPDNCISDIKFYHGTSTDTSVEEIASIVRKAIKSVRNGDCREVDLSI